MRFESDMTNSSQSEIRTAMRGHLMLLTILCVTFVCTGATCLPKRSIPEFQPTPIFSTPPNVEQLAEILNRSRNVQSLQSNFVTVNPNKIRNLDASFAWQRARRFSMKGGVSRMLGNNFEVGSNDQYFWMTLRDGSAPQLYYASHDQFEAQQVRRVLPVSPLWLIEAMGISEIDTRQPLPQPVNRADGMVELTTGIPSITGTFTRTLVVDPRYGYTREVYLRDPNGRLVANARQSQHEYYPSVQMSLPHRVLVQLSPATDPPIELDITIGKYAVNNLDPNQTSAFEMPNTSGYQVVNLTDFNQGLPNAVQPVQVAPPQNHPTISYRGISDDGFMRR